MSIKINYKPKQKNELALKKYIKNADKKQPKRTSRGNRIKQRSFKRINVYKFRISFKNNIAFIVNNIYF